MLPYPLSYGFLNRYLNYKVLLSNGHNPVQPIPIPAVHANTCHLLNVTLLHCKDHYWHWFSSSSSCNGSDSDVVGNSRFCDREGKSHKETIMLNVMKQIATLHLHSSMAAYTYIITLVYMQLRT